MRKLLCWLGCCTRVYLHDVPEGIGGRCIDCGRIHGWMSQDEIKRAAQRAVEDITDA